MTTSKLALKRARELREEIRERGEEFTTEEYKDLLRELLLDLADDLFDVAVDKIAETVDREAVRGSEDEDQQTFFDVYGEYKLGEGRRIAKQHAQLIHADQAMAIDDDNLIKVTTANNRKRRELTMLRPFWLQGMTKAQAIEAYHAAQEEAS